MLKNGVLKEKRRLSSSMCRILCNKVVKTLVLVLPCLPFEQVHQLQLVLITHKATHPDFPDVLLLTSHPACYTWGRASQAEERLVALDHPTFYIERGGHLTFHHPEQVILYPLMRLASPNVHQHLKRLLEWGQKALFSLGITTSVDGQGSGLWVNHTEKVASIGIAVRRWITYHGLAINVAVEASMWESLPAAIHPCGLAHAEPTNLKSLKGTLTRLDVENALVHRLEQDESLGPVQVHRATSCLTLSEICALVEFDDVYNR
jgi:lipoate-protein ligase B